jgi:hypothetical protein
MDCRHNITDTGKFSVFVTTSVLPREEINKRANTYQNFLNKDGTPKSRNRHPIEGKYTLAYHKDKIVDEGIKDKFQQIRKYIKTTNPTLKEEYTKRRLVFWSNSNQCLYAIEPHRKNFWLGINGKKPLKGYQRYYDQKKTFVKITNKKRLEDVLSLI